ncbi:MAG TPA: ATP-binding protein [Candidatus Kapabacteria bacterium]|nr:ATP-binding protein [Candidatus Kapabacteria bacterium]
MKIIKANEPLTVTSLKVLIYGEPGVGKTSVASTAEAPILLDFDKGAYRTPFRSDVMEVNNYLEIFSISEHLKDYKTIIIDTVDTFLDFIGSHILQDDPRLAKNKLQFYGRLKDEFSNVMKVFSAQNKDIIMISHLKEKEEGDLRIKRPAITGGSYDKVLQVADLVGFMYMANTNRVINFNPTDTSVGKNSANLDLVTVPNLNNNPTFFKELLQKVKQSLNIAIQNEKKAVDIVKEYKSIIEDADLEVLNSLLSDLPTLNTATKKQVWELMKRRANELNLVFDNNVKLFKQEVEQ